MFNAFKNCWTGFDTLLVSTILVFFLASVKESEAAVLLRRNLLILVLKAAAYTSSEGGDYVLGRIFYIAPQDTSHAKAYFLRRSAVHLLEELTFGSC